jgi:wyosine [tRNA(Phe)-imidazoG37] synthetase (radical SAM superfamily)
MNNRIKELAEQAGGEIWSRPPMRAVTGWAFTDENLEKFAKSVAKDCADLIADMVEHREPASTCVQKIEERYLIKEINTMTEETTGMNNTTEEPATEEFSGMRTLLPKFSKAVTDKTVSELQDHYDLYGKDKEFFMHVRDTYFAEMIVQEVCSRLDPVLSKQILEHYGYTYS